MAAIQQNGQMRRRKFDHCNGNLGKHDVLPGLDQKTRINHMINHVLAPVDSTSDFLNLTQDLPGPLWRLGPLSFSPSSPGFEIVSSHCLN